MPKILKMRLGPIIMEVPYYEELLLTGDPAHKGVLVRELPCHALWHYYVCATRAWDRAKKNIVYEDEASLQFNQNNARNLLQGIANLYGCKIEEMIPYWPLMERQRIALGGGDTLPSEYKFQFSIN